MSAAVVAAWPTSPVRCGELNGRHLDAAIDHGRRKCRREGTGVAFSIRFHGTSLQVSIQADELTVLAQAEGFRGPLRVGDGDEVRELDPGSGCVFPLPAQASSIRR